ncbi:hypothetical protein [Rhodococcus sp. ARC_M6]|uniref:hypothetical protein n=1 Tax=Rhodococcus sp. ARC_M6 TaxID=2928852 RepID=UPI001FB495C2|nr:hypothetical protein [Rhodococcus sp. ARC_M6]MCJ0906108.1 hypothetical protein [Rhodococcus sp. ARC_M6]
MRKTLIAAAAIAATAGLLIPGAVANAATDNQVVDFTVTAAAGGGLSVSIGGPVSTLALQSLGTTAKGSLTLFGIGDSRGGATGWNASLALEDFVNVSNPAMKIPATNATYTPNSVLGLIGGGSAPVVSTQLKNTPTVVITRSNRIPGAWLEAATVPNVNALSVDIPASVALGQYKATLTLSAV